jgi:cobalt-zinc-cadmium resistance protein CzcA
LKWQVKQLYFDIQYKKELEKLYTSLTTTYAEYYQKSEVRVKSGAVNAIESLTLKSKWQEYQLLLRQLKIEIDNLNLQFQLLLNTLEPVTTTNSLGIAAYSANLDSISNPFLLQFKQVIAIESAKIAVLKSDLKPSFNLGYAAQRFYEGGWLNAFQAGISLSLFNGQTKKRIEAQKMQVEIGNFQYQSKVIDTKQEQLKIQNTLSLYQEGIQFYKDQLETINPEVLRIGQLNYHSGEISYLELLNSLQLLITNNINYWEQIRAFNKAVADYQFLTNQ